MDLVQPVDGEPAFALVLASLDDNLLRFSVLVKTEVGGAFIVSKMSIENERSALVGGQAFFGLAGKKRIANVHRWDEPCLVPPVRRVAVTK